MTVSLNYRSGIRVLDYSTGYPVPPPRRDDHPGDHDALARFGSQWYALDSRSSASQGFCAVESERVEAPNSDGAILQLGEGHDVCGAG